MEESGNMAGNMEEDRSEAVDMDRAKEHQQAEARSQLAREQWLDEVGNNCGVCYVRWCRRGRKEEGGTGIGTRWKDVRTYRWRSMRSGAGVWSSLTFTAAGAAVCRERYVKALGLIWTAGDVGIRIRCSGGDDGNEKRDIGKNGVGGVWS